MTPEGKIEKHLKKEVEASGGKVRKLKWIGKSGAPDRFIWWPRKSADQPLAFALVELKAANKKPTKLQEIEHEALKEDGFHVLVLDSIEAVDRAIVLVRDGVVVPEGGAKGTTPAPRKRIPPADHVDVRSPPNLPKLDNSDLA